MAKEKIVAVTDYNFPNLNPEKEVLLPLGVKLIDSQCRKEDDIIELCKSADAVLTQFAPVTSRVIENLKNVKLIVRYGIGVDNVDIKTARKYNIDVANVPEYCINEVADHATGLILCSVRKICQFNSSVKKGIWNLNRLRPIIALDERTLGLIGFGRIAKAVAHRMKAFGLKVVSHDPYAKEEAFESLNVKRVSFDELLKESDIISIHIPLTESNRHFINKETFKKMKPNAIIINTARGAVIDEKALIEVLEEKTIGGAALDVFEKEPIDPVNPLIKFDNVILTSHCASHSERSMLRLQYSAADEVARFIKGERPLNIIN